VSDGSLPIPGITRYELFRIVIPGLFASALACLMLFLYYERGLVTITSKFSFTLFFVMLALLAGVILYELDYPRRTHEFLCALKHNSSKSYLQERCKSCSHKPKPDDQTLTLVSFYLFNSMMDDVARERAFYFASVYYMYTNIVLILKVFVGLSVAMIILNHVNPILDQKFISQGAAAAAALMLMLFFNRRGAKHKRFIEESFNIQRVWLKLNWKKVESEICEVCKSEGLKLQ